MRYPRLLLAAGGSGSGKTMVTCGLLQALVNRGIPVTSFKCGPDYIDQMFHSNVIGTKSRNLDTFFTEDAVTRYLFARHADGSDLSIIEGVMGYYDGLGTTTKASTYDMAGVLQAPTVLIVNCQGMSLSVVAHIKGFLEYKKDSHIKGVLLNQISSMMYLKLKAIIENELEIPVFGYIEKLPDLVIESRHLGLIMPAEVEALGVKLNSLAEHLEKTVDIDGLLTLAQTAEELEIEVPQYTKIEGSPVIGIARDEAFCFLYEDNIELLQRLGADIVEISPLHDRELPSDLSGLVLPGGYPELYAKELSGNESMKHSIKEFIMQGGPCMAECGGFMYLHTEMEDIEGSAYPMVDIITGKAYKTDRLGRFGYVDISSQKPQFLLETKDETIKGHEFHYYDSTSCGDIFYAAKPAGNRGWHCIHGDDHFIAGFPHLYYYSNPNAVSRFLKKCTAYRNEKGVSIK